MRPDQFRRLAKLRRRGVGPRGSETFSGGVGGALRAMGLAAVLLLSAPLSGIALFATYEPLPGDLAPKSVHIPNRDLVMDVGHQMPLFQVTKDHFIGLHATFGGDYELCAFPKQDRRGKGTAWVSADRNLVFGIRTKSCKGKLQLNARQDLPIIGENGSQLTVKVERYGRAVRIDVPRPKGFELARQSTTGQGTAAGNTRGSIISNQSLNRLAVVSKQSRSKVLTDAKIESVMRKSPTQPNLQTSGKQSAASARLLSSSSMHVEATAPVETSNSSSEAVSMIIGVLTSRVAFAVLGTILLFAFAAVGVRALRRTRATRIQRRPEPGIPPIPTAAAFVPASMDPPPLAPEPAPAPAAEPPPLPLPRPEECDTVVQHNEKPTVQPRREPEPQLVGDFQGFAVEDMASPSQTPPANAKAKTEDEDSDLPVFGGQGDIFSLTGSVNQ